MYKLFVYHALILDKFVHLLLSLVTFFIIHVPKYFFIDTFAEFSSLVPIALSKNLDRSALAVVIKGFHGLFPVLINEFVLKLLLGLWGCNLSKMQ